MELCVKTYNVGSQSKEDFKKFIIDIKNNVDFDNQEIDTMFKQLISYWLIANKLQNYAFSKLEFEKSAEIYSKMLDIKKEIISIWNNETNFSHIIKNTYFCVALNKDGTSNVSHLL